MTPPDPTPLTGEAAAAIGAAVLADPDVVALDGGAFDTVATALPGRRVVGVRVGAGGVEVSVVLAWGTQVPAVAGRVRDRVRALLGPVPVDVHVADLATGPPAAAG
ncbi:Asp23/Gls24 family envelope stress response protein [Actinokineospora pegani]|uniref:hypothetical protein n=1 Tax=Actinokineospora pegani TaxID=2654637 RepID=UPI001F30C021|nr:hypothetical protein [Actinokineospora pegani]